MKHHVIIILIFNVVLILDNDENAINNGDNVALFNLSKFSNKLYGNIVHKIQIEMSNFIQVPASLVFATISEFWFLGFSRLTIYKLIATFLIAFLIKINNKRLGQIISKLLSLSKTFTCSLILFFTWETFLNTPSGYWNYNW